MCDGSSRGIHLMLRQLILRRSFSVFRRGRRRCIHQRVLQTSPPPTCCAACGPHGADAGAGARRARGARGARRAPAPTPSSLSSAAFLPAVTPLAKGAASSARRCSSGGSASCRCGGVHASDYHGCDISGNDPAFAPPCPRLGVCPRQD